MRIQVIVKTNAKAERVEEMDAKTYKIFVNVPPIEGRANEAVIRILSKHFHVPQSSVQIKAGLKSKQKLVEILKF